MSGSLFKLTLFYTGVILLLLPPVTGLSDSKSQHSTFRLLPALAPLQLAQSYNCKGTGRLLYAGETKNYWLSICTNNIDTTYYVSIPKNGSKGIILDCVQGSLPGHINATCTAINGEYNYIVYPTQLIVIKRGRVILQEKITRFRKY